MGKSKTKAIQADLGTFRQIRNIQELFRHIQAYSKPCVTLAYLNRGISRTLTYSEPEAYSEP